MEQLAHQVLVFGRVASTRNCQPSRVNMSAAYIRVSACSSPLDAVPMRMLSSGGAARRGVFSMGFYRARSRPSLHSNPSPCGCYFGISATPRCLHPPPRCFSFDQVLVHNTHTPSPLGDERIQKFFHAAPCRCIVFVENSPFQNHPTELRSVLFIIRKRNRKQPITDQKTFEMITNA